MKLRPKVTIADYFSELKDPRIERSKQHKLIDIITITGMVQKSPKMGYKTAQILPAVFILQA